MKRGWIWIAVATLILVAMIAFLWIGTTHRDRCLRAGNVGCTILPWSGQAATSSGWGSGGYLIPGFSNGG